MSYEGGGFTYDATLGIDFTREMALPPKQNTQYEMLHFLHTLPRTYKWPTQGDILAGPIHYDSYLHFAYSGGPGEDENIAKWTDYWHGHEKYIKLLAFVRPTLANVTAVGVKIEIKRFLDVDDDTDYVSDEWATVNEGGSETNITPASGMIIEFGPFEISDYDGGTRLIPYQYDPDNIYDPDTNPDGEIGDPDDASAPSTSYPFRNYKIMSIECTISATGTNLEMDLAPCAILLYPERPTWE